MNEPFSPAYLSLYQSGELARRARRTHEHLVRCDLCPNYCRVNRLQTLRGARCRSGRRAVVASYGPHHGEERVLVGRQGSGTLFFGRCNLRCVFCQNWDLSQDDQGREVTAAELAAMMLELQGVGCHNINLVSPSHVLAPLLAALALAVRKGLRLPLVYNTGGYDSPEALALLDGVVDIYMPDMKFADSKVAEPLLGVAKYAEINRAAVREMHRQVGDLVLDDQGIARRGILIRHLVLPENLAGSDRILPFVAEQLSPNTWLNLMDQYRPCYRADRYPPLDRPPSRTEYRRALRWAAAAGLQRLDRC